MSDATFKMFSVSRERLGAHFNSRRNFSPWDSWVEEEIEKTREDRVTEWHYNFFLLQLTFSFVLSFRNLHKHSRRDSRLLIGCRLLPRKLANRNEWYIAPLKPNDHARSNVQIFVKKRILFTRHFKINITIWTISCSTWVQFCSEVGGLVRDAVYPPCCLELFCSVSVPCRKDDRLIPRP